MGFFDTIAPSNIPDTMDPAMREMLRQREIRQFQGGIGQMGGALMAAGMAPRRQRGAILSQGFQQAGQSMSGMDPMEAMQLQGLMARNKALQAEVERKKKQNEMWQAALGALPAQAPALAAIQPPQDLATLDYKSDYSPVLGGAPGEKQLAKSPASLMGGGTAAPGGLFADLGPQEVNLLRMMGPEEGLKYLVGRAKPPRDTERDKLRADLKAQGHSEDEIREFMVNRDRYQFSTDPFGARIVFDRYKGEPVAGAQRTAAAAETPKVPEGVPTLQGGFEAGTGGSGFFGNIANTISDALGQGLVAPETEKARTALDTLQTRTMLQMTAVMPGRPSNLIRERLETLAVKPGSLFQADERALERLTQTRGLISEEMARLDTNLANPAGFQPKDLATMRANKSQLQELDKVYEHIIGNWRSGSATQTPGAPAQVKSREEFEKLPSGTIFVAPDGSLRRKP